MHLDVLLPRATRSIAAALLLSLPLAAQAMPAAAAGDDHKPSNPRTWKVAAGAQSRDEGIQVNAFLTRDISVDVGDTVNWSVPTAEFHTVTFLSGAPKPDFIVVGPNGPDINPHVAAPAGGSTYNGSGYANSGLLVEGGSYPLTFTTAGDFAYLCVVHKEMKGTVHVRPGGTRYPKTQTEYDAQAAVERAGLIGQGVGLEAQGLLGAIGPRQTAVTAGIGKFIPNVATLAIMRFEPDRRRVHVGDTVTWTNKDPETPHTVTFGTEPAGGPLATFAPSGIDGPGHATVGAPGQSVNSGFLGADVPFGTQFQVKFTAPGVYPYICALHDELGMVGTIEVVR